MVRAAWDGGPPPSFPELQWVHGRRTVVRGPAGVIISRSFAELQWVHGRRTVVRARRRVAHAGQQQLQWVHGRRTVVRMSSSTCWLMARESFNGSTVGEPWLGRTESPLRWAAEELQWVHGRRTVVRYTDRWSSQRQPSPLQWVHGRRTVVRRQLPFTHRTIWRASMGPRSENRG